MGHGACDRLDPAGTRGRCHATAQYEAYMHPPTRLTFSCRPQPTPSLGDGCLVRAPPLAACGRLGVRGGAQPRSLRVPTASQAMTRTVCLSTREPLLRACAPWHWTGKRIVGDSHDGTGLATPPTPPLRPRLAALEDLPGMSPSVLATSLSPPYASEDWAGHTTGKAAAPGADHRHHSRACPSSAADEHGLPGRPGLARRPTGRTVTRHGT